MGWESLETTLDRFSERPNKAECWSWKKGAVKILIFEWSGKPDKETSLVFDKGNSSRGGEIKELIIWAVAKATVRKERSGRAVKQLRSFWLD